MGTFKCLDDIERERIEREHFNFKEKIVKDSGDIINRVTRNIREEKIRNRSAKNKVFRLFVYISLVVIALLLCINAILLNVWVLKWVIKSLFGL